MAEQRIHPETVKGEGETRAQRGVRLFKERGSEIVFYPVSGEYGVPSATEEGILYAVDLEAETCECPDHQCRKVVCQHMVCLEAYLAAKRRKKAPVSARRYGLGAAA